VDGLSVEQTHGLDLPPVDTGGQSFIPTLMLIPCCGKQCGVIHNTKWNIGKELKKEFNKINCIVVCGEGFNDEVSSKLLGCQKQLAFEIVMGQASRDQACNHWTDLMHAINLGKKNLVAENYERLMCCLFMQEYADVLANGKLIMTNQVKHVPPDGYNGQPPQQFGDEQGRSHKSDLRYRSGNYHAMREHGGEPFNKFGTRQGERHGADIDGRYASRNNVDDRVGGNDNGPCRNNATMRPAARSASSVKGYR